MEENEKIKAEIAKLKRENLRLVGEVSILRSNITSLEKENYTYKSQQSNSILGNLTKLDEATKQVKFLRTENKLIENQLKSFNENQKNTLTEERLSINSLSLFPFEYERLKRMHNYFFHEYKQILETEVIKNELMKLRKNFSEFSKHFEILCIKKELFEIFFPKLILGYFFDDFCDPKVIFNVLTNFPIDWIQKFITDKSICSVLNDFLVQNVNNSNTVIFYVRIIENRHYLLNFLMDASIFNKIIEKNDFYSKYFLKAICKKGINKFINESNLHLINEDLLKELFKDDYIKF